MPNVQYYRQDFNTKPSPVSQYSCHPNLALLLLHLQRIFITLEYSLMTIPDCYQTLTADLFVTFSNSVLTPLWPTLVNWSNVSFIMLHISDCFIELFWDGPARSKISLIFVNFTGCLHQNRVLKFSSSNVRGSRHMERLFSMLADGTIIVWRVNYNILLTGATTRGVWPTRTSGNPEPTLFSPIIFSWIRTYPYCYTAAINCQSHVDAHDFVFK